MITNREIIKRAGGPATVAKATGKTPHRVTEAAVWKWYRNGIPSEQWPLIMRLSGVSLQEIFDANEGAPPGKPRPKPPRAEAAA